MSSTTTEHHRECFSLRWVLLLWQFAAAASSSSALLDSTTPQTLLPAMNNQPFPWDVESLSRHNHRMNHDDQNQIEMTSEISKNNQEQHRSLQTPCVRNQRQLKSAVRNTPNFTYTKIDICSKYMAIDARQTKMGTDYQGIFLNQKIIDFRCRFRNKCILDAQGLSRHFYSFNSTITFRGVQFVNGNADNDIIGGGSLCFERSILTLIRCDMSNNTGIGGGAVYVSDSNLLLYGGTTPSAPSLFENNMAQTVKYCAPSFSYRQRDADGNGGAICSYGNNKLSTISGYFLFSNNFACKEFTNNWSQKDGGAIYAAEGGNVNVANILFRNNSAVSRPFSCHAIGSITRYHASLKHFSSLTNEQFLFHDATCWGRGGAYASYASGTGFMDVIFQGNSAPYGASLFLVSNFDELLQLDNVTMLHDTGLTNCHGFEEAIFFLVDTRANARKLSVMKAIQAAGIYDFKFGTTAWIQVAPDEFVDGTLFSNLNLALAPPNRMQARRNRELVRDEFKGLWRRRSLQPCVFTATSLRYQVNACDSAATGSSCIVSICAKFIRINYEAPTNGSIASGIDLSNKRIKIICQQTKWRCRLDGQGLSRIFYGSNASVIFRSIVFMNGYHVNDGGAIMMKDGSDVSAWDCSFENNTASLGSAIAVYDTTLHVAGNRTTFLNNQGDTPPLFSSQSALDLSDAFFAQNGAAKYGGGGVLLFYSTINIYNTTFSNRSTGQSENCGVFNVFDSYNFLNGGYCFNYNQ